MKKLFLLILCTCSSLYAESKVLPPVIDNSMYPGGSAYATPVPSTSANAIYEVLGRLEQLQHEVQQLRGIVEEQSQTIIDLKKRQGNIYSDLDLRLQELTGIVGQKTQAGLAETAVTAEQIAAVEPVTGSNSAASSVPETASSKATESTANAPAQNQKALYQAAYETLRNGHNTRAIAEFKFLLAEFPAGEFADNAQYWLGEAYKSNQDLESAKAAFIKVVTHFGGSPKVPGAFLKLGYIELEQNNIAKARDYLTQVTVSYPDSTPAHLAKKKLIEMGVIHP